MKLEVRSISRSIRNDDGWMKHPSKTARWLRYRFESDSHPTYLHWPILDRSDNASRDIVRSRSRGSFCGNESNLKRVLDIPLRVFGLYFFLVPEQQLSKVSSRQRRLEPTLSVESIAAAYRLSLLLGSIWPSLREEYVCVDAVLSGQLCD